MRKVSGVARMLCIVFIILSFLLKVNRFVLVERKIYVSRARKIRYWQQFEKVWPTDKTKNKKANAIKY